jgi:hypothetical protein
VGQEAGQSQRKRPPKDSFILQLKIFLIIKYRMEEVGWFKEGRRRGNL